MRTIPRACSSWFVAYSVYRADARVTRVGTGSSRLGEGVGEECRLCGRDLACRVAAVHPACELVPHYSSSLQGQIHLIPLVHRNWIDGE